jgi:MraZ protein
MRDGEGVADMRFIARHEAAVDEKRRVTIPASFRTVLRAGRAEGDDVQIYVWKKPGAPFLEGAGEAYIARLEAALDELAASDPEGAERLSAAIFGGARALGLDGTGRIVLPADIAESAGITDRAVFAGMGAYFRLMAPSSEAAGPVDEALYAKVHAMARRPAGTLAP